MSKIKVGINGVGRIGRTLFREFYERGIEDFELVALNNPGNPDPYIHLIKYDSVHGRFSKDLQFQLEGNELMVEKTKRVKFFNIKDPSEIPWESCGVDLVIDATGRFKDKESLSLHMRGSVKKVVMCAPGKNLDATFVMGINHKDYDGAQHHIVSNASCTTNCLAPVAKVLNDRFGIQSGFMVTVHAYTSDQQLLDGSHSDLRRARAANLSMIPTTTGAAKSVGQVIPELKGKLDGYAVRVPTPNVSMVDLSVTLDKNPTSDEVNKAFIEASQGELRGILTTESAPLVSTDFNGMRESSCIDLSLTNVIDNNYKIVAWYDNEVGFSNRVLDLAAHMAKSLK